VSAPLRIAVVGAGRMGQVHLQACGRARGVAAVAVVEPAAKVRDRLAPGLAAYADVEELLAAGGFEAVVIAAPSDQHRALVVRLAAAGVPMLCEKPGGLNGGDVRAGAAAARVAGVVLQVGYWRRFVPQLVDLQARIAAGELGTPSLVLCHQWDEQPPSRKFERHSGGIAIDMGVHELDQLRWLTGQEIEWVTEARGSAEQTVLLAGLSGGTLGVVTLGRRFPQPDSCWVEVIGPDGHARSDFMWGEPGRRTFADAIVAQLEAFAAAVTSEQVRGADGADAAAAIEAAERLPGG
jgi:myo-inositol 2-dehydrogenase / D-chiro-inositol 1-dehydrogenase